MREFHGTDVFTYRATDSNMEQSAIATVEIVVDTAPVCADSSATVESGRPLLLPELPCSDADGDDFGLFLGDPDHGTLEISQDGLTATYTSAPGYVGTDTILYEAEDSFGVFSAPGVLVITVAAPPPQKPPVLPPSPPPATDTTAPDLALDRPGRRLRRMIRNGMRLTLDSSEAGSLSVTLSVDRATARRLELKRNPRRRVVVGRLQTAAAAGRTELTVKLTRKARRAMRREAAVRVRVKVVMTDAAGNDSTDTATVTLRR
jgi:hypothetical protein